LNGNLEAECATRLGKKALHRVQCVLRDAPLLRRAAPQHEDILLIALRKTPHPEVPREARPRRTHDILPALRHSCPASALFRATLATDEPVNRRSWECEPSVSVGRSLDRLEGVQCVFGISDNAVPIIDQYLFIEVDPLPQKIQIVRIEPASYYLD
jgi:hypothetical protein